MFDSMHAADHRDWHALARSEGVNEWDCPFDCIDAGDLFADGDGPELFATVWRPGVNRGGVGFKRNLKDWYGYPVFSREQLRAYAITAAARMDVNVIVTYPHHTDSVPAAVRAAA